MLFLYQTQREKMVKVNRIGETGNKQSNDIDFISIIKSEDFSILSKDFEKQIQKSLVSNFPGFENKYYKTITKEILVLFSAELSNKNNKLCNLVEENKNIKQQTKAAMEDLQQNGDECFEMQTSTMNAVDAFGKPIDIKDRFKLGKI